MIRLLSFSVLSLLFTAAAQADVASNVEGIDIENAWIAEAPPVSKVNAAYMTISNSGSADVTLVSIDCANYSSAEFHRTIEDDGVARMRRQQTLQVPAASKLELAPGGYHVMLFNPQQALRSGDKAACTLALKNGRRIEFTPEVRNSADHHSHHHHH